MSESPDSYRARFNCWARAGFRSDRNLRRILDLPQREVARGIGDAGMGEHALADEAVVIGDVAHRDAQQIIPLARHRIAFDDLVAPRDEALEIGARVDRLAVHADLAEDVDRAAEPGGVGEADGGPEHALLFEVAHPPPDRGRRGADALRKRRVAEARIALERANDSTVDLVEMIIFAHVLPIS